jgi:histidinol-phosphate aminotransferase
MNTSPTPLAHLGALQPYRAVKALDMRHNLSANEACLGPSPMALSAAKSAAKELARYPDGSAEALRQAIGRRYGIDADRIVCSAGSEELISLLVQAFAAPGDEVLFSQYGFIKYELAARAFGATPVRAPERNFKADVDALLAAVSPRTRVLFLANPNNPTGTHLAAAEVQRLREGLREDVLLVLDAAYAEYVEEEDYADGLGLATTTHNTIVLRTFSKIHGLAALRCGWGYAAAPVIEALHKIRGAFNVGTIAQAAAIAAVSDVVHERRARVHTTRWREWLAQRLGAAGYTVIPSVTNFIVVRFEDAGRCSEALAELGHRGVLAMPLTGYGLPEALRITVGTAEANELVANALCGVAA